jgi:hypothetical protein
VKESVCRLICRDVHPIDVLTVRAERSQHRFSSTFVPVETNVVPTSVGVYEPGIEFSDHWLYRSGWYLFDCIHRFADVTRARAISAMMIIST